MLKFTMHGETGRKLVGIGLTAENVRRLQANDPIFFDGAEVGFESIDFLIMAGETQKDIMTELQKHFPIGPMNVDLKD